MINVIYEDNHVIVVEKPRNIPVQVDSSGDTDLISMVREYIREKYDKKGNVYLGLVHRLDRPVGGLMVFARTSKAASRLSEEIRKGNVEKYYTALVHGVPKKHGVLEDWLLKDERTNTTTVVPEGTAGSKYAKLEYEVTDSDGRDSQVYIHLYTGRSHQIRVQFASRGYPLIGDMRYGRQEKGRIALFASGLSFIHPNIKKKMSFSLEPDMKLTKNE